MINESFINDALIEIGSYYAQCGAVCCTECAIYNKTPIAGEDCLYLAFRNIVTSSVHVNLKTTVDTNEYLEIVEELISVISNNGTCITHVCDGKKCILHKYNNNGCNGMCVSDIVKSLKRNK